LIWTKIIYIDSIYYLIREKKHQLKGKQTKKNMKKNGNQTTENLDQVNI
jgi:hypothetical protein